MITCMSWFQLFLAKLKIYGLIFSFAFSFCSLHFCILCLLSLDFWLLMWYGMEMWNRFVPILSCSQILSLIWWSISLIHSTTNTPHFKKFSLKEIHCLVHSVKIKIWIRLFYLLYFCAVVRVWRIEDGYCIWRWRWRW